MPRKLIASNINNVSNKQHRTPCSDCPFRRDSLPGWLGGIPAEFFTETAHGEGTYNCHVIVNQQCAGMAVYRANVCKTPRYIAALALPADKQKVFAWPTEFLEHHIKLPSKDS